MSGLFMSSVKVQLSAITAFHVLVEGFLTSSDHMEIPKRLYESFFHRLEPLCCLGSLWAISYRLAVPSVYENGFSDGHYFCSKVWGDRDCNGKFSIYYILNGKISFGPHPKFLPKVSSEFYINQTIHIPVFFPEPHLSTSESALHILCVKRAHWIFTWTDLGLSGKPPRLYFC